MFNFLDKIRDNPEYYKQLSVDTQLVTLYECPLDETRVDLWSHQHYFVYVIDGKKIWHSQQGPHELTKGKCCFVRQGAHIVEQFFNTPFCVILFFLTEDFITNTLASIIQPENENSYSSDDFPTIFPVTTDDSIHAFFQSVVPFFYQSNSINKTLLELKFRELLMHVTGNPANKSITGFFHSMLINDSAGRMRKVMEENFCYNLKLEDYARLCGKSLSSFKRSFDDIYKTSPGQWLLEKRLNHARILIRNTTKPISEITFDCGFENTSHFSRAYRQFFGETPSDSRKELT
jgi:AraC-like DNA-binding protein